MQNGTSTPTTKGTTDPPDSKTIIGINFGNSYASIAVINKEGLADCIANEDGERQIDCAISYHGAQVYIGNQAKPQLVKNSENTIVGFRNLLGKKFSEITPSETPVSAPVVDLENNAPGYVVEILTHAPAAAPTPSRIAATATPTSRSAFSTPGPTRPPSPPPPTITPLKLTVQKATSLFLYSLKTSAEEFLGRKVDGAVISVPSWWGSGERAALREAAGEAGIHVYQLASEEGLAVLGSENSRTADAVPEGAKQDDRTTLVIDLGGSSLTLNVLSIKHSIVNSLSSAHIPSLGGSTVDSYLISHFSKEFTKKTKTPLPLPASTPGDRKAEAKMRLAVEHTKRTLSASTGAAACSVESLKDGLDFNGSINRLRFDVLLSPFYAQIIDHVSQVLAKANVPKEGINEVLLVGGSAGLPGLIERLVLYFGEGPGAAVIRDDLDPSQLIAKGAALQARLISELPEDSPLIRAFEDGTEVVKTKSSSKPIGLVFPGAEEQVVVVVPSHAPLPARRTVQFKSPGGKRLGMDIYEGEEVLRVIPGQEKPKVERDADDDDEEEEEEEPQKEVIVTKGQHLGSFVLPLDPKKELVEIRIDVHLDRSIHVAGRTISGTSGNDDWVSWTA